nr:hypothetical protein [Actinomycetota bacterium]
VLDGEAAPLLDREDAIGRGAALGGWSMFGNRAQQKVAEKAGGLPPMVILAVGPTQAYVFEYRTSGRSLDIGAPVAVWKRDDLDVTFKKRIVSSPLVIDVRSTGEHFELESTSMTGRLGKMTAELGRLLADPAAS